jgi:hypothetical protein
MPDPTMAEVLGSHNPNSIVRLRTARRITVIAMVVAAQLGSTGLAVGVAAAGPGLTTAVTVWIAGATGRWTPIGTTTPPVDELSSPNEPEPTSRS